MRNIAVIAVGLTMIAGAPGAKANLITNGTFAAGATGWTAFETDSPGVSDSVEVNPSSAYGLGCYDTACVNLEVNATTTDTVTQTVSGLTAGDTYTLSWGYSGRSGGGPQQLNVSFGGSLLAIETSSASNPWTTETFTVAATSTSEILSFASQSAGGLTSYGNEIAGVSLTQAVPEPASLALFGLGAFGLGMIRRKNA
jgi:hypothetical protein